MTLTTVSIEKLLVRLSDARMETDRLFASLDPGILYERPIPERHRIIFYIGHLEAFDWNLLRGALDLSRFHPEYDQLFAFGIDPVDGEDPSDQPADWPSFNQVETYRRRIRDELDAGLAEANETEQLADLLNIAIEHRLMHAETLEYMFHQLPYSAKIGSDEQPRGPAVVPVFEALSIPPGTISLGLERNVGQFGWDNEFELHTVMIPAFSIDKYKVTNRQFLEFVGQGGYRQRSIWEPADWEWKNQSKITHPVFWVPTKDGFRYRSMFEEVALSVDSPVYVSHAEATAYARWAGKALPTEAQWQRAAEGTEPPLSTRSLWDPPPVTSRTGSASRFGVEGLFGTGWEWTSTPFGPFSGFAAHPAYPGYSANFFDNRHFVMKGGSTRTAICMLRHSFRNWFQAHYQYVYAGFRCVSE